MDYLLDTNALIRVLYNQKQLNADVTEALSNPNNNIFISDVSLWEIEIKHLKRPDLIPFSSKDVFDLLTERDANLIHLSPSHIFRLRNVYESDIYRDPFDNLLVATAIEEKMTFITSDNVIGKYPNLNVLQY